MCHEVFQTSPSYVIQTLRQWSKHAQWHSFLLSTTPVLADTLNELSVSTNIHVH